MNGSTVLDVGVGVGALLAGVGLLLLCLRAARLVDRATVTLGAVDRYLAEAAPQVVRALEHVGGIAGTADATLARVGGIVDTVESVAGGAARTAAAAHGAVEPAIRAAGSVATALARRLRRLPGGSTGRGT